MRISKNILEETINIVTGQRQEDYGDKITNHQNIANLWSSYLDKKISAHDVARLKNKKTHDCYIDMAGYAAIAGEINDSDSSIPTTE